MSRAGIRFRAGIGRPHAFLLWLVDRRAEQGHRRMMATLDAVLAEAREAGDEAERLLAEVGA